MPMLVNFQAHGSPRKARHLFVHGGGRIELNLSLLYNDSFRLALRAAHQELNVIPGLRSWLP
jgi:hypothetical protein